MLGLSSSECFGQTAKIDAVLEFTGQCVKYEQDTEDHNYCENIVRNLRYADGYESFQFRTPTKSRNDSDRDNIVFVGSHWGDNKGAGDAKKLGDEMIFMTLEQVVLSNAARNSQTIKQSNNIVDSVCLSLKQRKPTII